MAKIKSPVAARLFEAGRRRVLAMSIALLSTLATSGAAAQPAAMATDTPDARSQPRVYIVHGYAASPADHWFPWLRDKLLTQGVDVSLLALPDATSPHPAEWHEFLAAEVDRYDRNTFFVAHSLGCVALLRLLQAESAGRKIGGIVLVSGFVDPLPQLPQLDGFTSGELDLERIADVATRRVVVAARDDTIVPYRLSETLARALRAPLLSVDNGGHFLASDGYRELPIVYEALMQMLSSGQEEPEP